MFNPSQAGVQFQSLQNLVFNQLENLPIDQRRVFARRIFFQGGAAQLKNLEERFVKEMVNINTEDFPIETLLS